MQGCRSRTSFLFPRTDTAYSRCYSYHTPDLYCNAGCRVDQNTVDVVEMAE